MKNSRMFTDLFSYLNNNSSTVEIVAAKDRPILGDGVTEIYFPYLTPSEFQQHNQRLLHQLSDGLLVSDEVMDEAAIEDEEQLAEYQNQGVLNTKVSHYLGRFNWLFNEIYQTSQRGTLYISTLVKKLPSLNSTDADLPIVIKLELKYQLSHKLRSRTGRLNSNLRRINELMPIGQIQELDSYSLRDYIRRPGNTPEEKAGSKQQLMGVKRYQDYNNLENQFLVYFTSKILHLECFRYEKEERRQHLEIVTKLRQVIETFKQDPAVKEIKIRGFKLTRPNYVLQQNADYRGFYQAYQDYIKQKNEKINIWGYRNRLFGEVVYIHLVAALLQLQGVKVSPTSKLELRNSPDLGSYLTSSGVNLQVFLHDTVYDFDLAKSEKLQGGDYSLRIDKHDLNSTELNIQQITLFIWVFWYRPSQNNLKEAERYLQGKEGVVIYLEGTPQLNDPSWLKQFPYSDITQFLAQQIIIPLAERII